MPVSKRFLRVVAVGIPPSDAKEFGRFARQEGRTTSELFREMILIYSAHRETASFETLQRYGAAWARALGIRTQRDVKRLEREARD